MTAGWSCGKTVRLNPANTACAGPVPLGAHASVRCPEGALCACEAGHKPPPIVITCDHSRRRSPQDRAGKQCVMRCIRCWQPHVWPCVLPMPTPHLNSSASPPTSVHLNPQMRSKRPTPSALGSSVASPPPAAASPLRPACTHSSSSTTLVRRRRRPISMSRCVRSKVCTTAPGAHVRNQAFIHAVQSAATSVTDLCRLHPADHEAIVHHEAGGYRVLPGL